MRVLSVVGNRPQFIKSGPLSVALREAGIDEVVAAHGPALGRGDVATSSSTSSSCPSRRTGSTCTPPTRTRCAPAIVAARRARAARLGARLRRHELDARRRRGGAADVPVAHVEAGLRSGDLSMPEERNRIAVDRIVGAAALPRRALGARRSRARASPGRIEVVGDVMADACFRLRADRARALADPRAARARARRRTSSRRSTARRTSQPERLARIVDGLGRIDEPVVFPAHPRTRAAARRDGCRPNVALRRAARLPRHGGARLAGARDRHRLRRPAEGGVLVRRAVRDRAALDRVGRHRRGRRERARRRRPGRGSPPRSRRRACPTSGRRSTATATPRSGSRPLCAASACPRHERTTSRSSAPATSACRSPHDLRRGGLPRRSLVDVVEPRRRRAEPRREPHRGRRERAARRRSSSRASSARRPTTTS